MPKNLEGTQKIQVVFELGPVTTIVLIQLLLVILKLTQTVAWTWMQIFIPLWVILLIIVGSMLIGSVYWVTSNFILGRKKE